MKRIVKISLATAIVVAGLSANAKPLEEAIKNVDVSGTVVYRYDDFSDKVGGQNSTTNKYKIALNLSSKVNENVKVNTRFVIGAGAGVSDTVVGGSLENDLGLTFLNSRTSADGQLAVRLSNVYFGYTGIANTTINIGKQGLTTPWTVAVDPDGAEQTGTGILALSTLGVITLAGGYFNQTNLNASGDNLVPRAYTFTGAENLATLAVIAKAGGITLDAWYLQMADTFDTFTIGAKGSFKTSGVKLGADVRYTSLELDEAIVANSTNSLLKVMLTAKAGIVNAKYIYAMTDKDGGLTALDRDATTTLILWGVTILGKADATLHSLSLGVQAMNTLHLSANFATMDYVSNGTRDDNEEQAYLRAAYKMSKNFTTFVMLGTFEQEIGNTQTIDNTRGRLQVQYSF